MGKRGEGKSEKKAHLEQSEKWKGPQVHGDLAVMSAGGLRSRGKVVMKNTAGQSQGQGLRKTTGFGIGDFQRTV